MIKKQLGNVGVDSGQLLITDPCYIDSQWEKKNFEDIRIYKHKKLNKIFGYNKSKLGKLKLESFKSYEEITSTKKTMNKMILNKEVIEIDLPEKVKLINTYSYAGICETTSKNQHQLNFKLGHAGVGIVFQSGYGDGFYPVYGYFNDEGICIKIEIDCEMTKKHQEIFDEQEKTKKSILINNN